MAQQYSEWGQDRWAIDMAGPMPAPGPGFFLDSNAGHAIHRSNTFLLEEKYGWSGICIDDVRENLESLGSIRHKSSVVSMDSSELARRMAETLDILKAPGLIDYWNLNVVGRELEILRRFPWNSRRVTALSVKLSPGNSGLVSDFLANLGYTIPSLRPPNQDGYYVSYVQPIRSRRVGH